MKSVFWPLAWAGLLVAGCGQKSVENLDNTLNIQSNAYFMAFQNGGPEAPWEVRVRDNSDYNPLTRGVSVDNNSRRFGLLFACPSQQEGDPHRVTLYLGVAGEIRMLRHTCRKAEQERTVQRIYGSVRGVAENRLDAPSSEMAVVALDADVSMVAYEGYAAKTFLRSRDVLAFKGELDARNNQIAPQRFYRELSTASGELVRIDIDFDDAGRTADVVGTALGQVSIVGRKTGESLHSLLGFISEKGTFLPLVESREANFGYRAVPRRGKNGGLFINEGEGHRLRVEVNAEAVPTRRVVVFFREQHDVEVTVPQAPAGQPGYDISVRTSGKRLEVTARLPSYDDANYGAGTLYRLRFLGDASEAGLPLEWTVYLTQQWLGSDSSLSLRLPFLEGLEGWRTGWEFKAASRVESFLSTFASRAKAGEILDHLQTGRFADGLVYAEILQSDSAP